MTHENIGNFAGKHPPGTQVPAQVRDAVASQLDDQGISCHKAHTIAENLGISPKQVGIAVDLQEGRLRKCQLGLFGHDPAKKAVKAADTVDPALKGKIESALVDGRLPCKTAWQLADSMGISRMTVANVCEALKIRINQCQLGAF